MLRCVYGLTDLAEAQRRADIKEVKALAHKLLGSARTVCARNLADSLAALEQAAHDGLRNELEGRLQQVTQAFQQVCDWLAGRGAPSG